MARDLVDFYGSETKAAVVIGCDQSTLNRIKRGAIADPRLALGLRMIDAHAAIQKAR